jgi:hypothetical protein
MLFAEVAVGSGKLVGTVQAKAQVVRTTRAQWPDLRAWFTRVLSAAADHLPDAARLSAQLESVKGRLAPIPVSASVLSVEIDQSPVSVLKGSRILNMPTSQITKMLAVSDIGTDAIPFRTTVLHDGRAAVTGNATKTIGGLSGLIHEAAHWLVDNDATDPFSIDQAVKSEAAAHWMEREVVAEYLDGEGRTSDLRNWLAYQHSVDLINLHYFLREAFEFNVGQPVEFLTDPALDLIRESYFRCPGYQVAYGHASLERIEKGYDARRSG